MAKVISITPIYKAELSENEVLSVRQLLSVLPDIPHYFIAPKGLQIEFYEKTFPNSFQIIRFDNRFFESPQTYNTLMRSKELFEAFHFSEYFLMYHTDAWVFRNELQVWVNKGYSYIGAPMYEYNGTILGGNYIGVGQGGFSLHHIPSALKVLNSHVLVYPFSELWNWYERYNWKGKLKFLPYFLWSALGFTRMSKSGWNKCKVNEDVWWGKYINDAFDWYSVPTIEEATKFSMEFNCKKLLEENNGELPFGTHQWFKPLFSSFWDPYIVID